MMSKMIGYGLAFLCFFIGSVNSAGIRRGLTDPYVYEEATEAPVACDPMSDVVIYLYDAEADVPIGPLGSTIDSCMYGGTGLALVAGPECKRHIKFTLYDKEGMVLMSKTEGVAPFSLGGDIGVDILPVAYLSMPGMYTVSADPTPGEMETIRFEVLGC